MKIKTKEITLDTRIVTRMKVYEAYRRLVFTFNFPETERQGKIEIQINNNEQFEEAVNSIQEALEETGIDTLVIFAPSAVYNHFEYYTYVDAVLKVTPADIDIKFNSEDTDEE